MRAILLISTLFKTTEFKINASNELKITELTLSGEKSKSINLNSMSVKQGLSCPSYLSWLLLSLGFISVLAVFTLSKYFPLLHNNLLNSIFFLSSIFGTLWFISKPEKSLIYSDSFTKKVLFRINNPISMNNATASFLSKLNATIDETKKAEENLINLKSNAKLQLEIHNKNVDDLMNSGLIDEALYKRICNSMHESVFGEEKTYSLDNVVYLNK